MRIAPIGSLFIALFCLAGPARAANVLFVSDCGAGDNIPVVLAADGHSVTSELADFATGNPFTNANKTLDHIMAHGPAAAAGIEPPLLYSGVRLPATYIQQAANFLRAADLLPDAGYLGKSVRLRPPPRK